ncbi:MAG: ATP-binding protein [Bacteroidota bacterium]
MQAELKTTKLYGGTGLGLAISQGLVQSFKGQIWLESEEGKGSVFNFSIPLLLE